MAEIETLGVLEEIQALVSDKLQVVSYKWLSRNFLVSSNAAKRLLQEFVEKHGSNLEVVYALAGWLKKNPPTYNIRLVSGPKLAEAKKDFDEVCSVQVYSVQASLPKDPAALWNAEFVQAEELFKQPPGVNNCLRDNRFCGISSSFVKRNVEGTSVGFTVPQPKTAHPAQPPQVKQSSPKVAIQPSNVLADIKSESNGRRSNDDKEKVSTAEIKKKAQIDKSSSGTGGSLANLWGRASTKSKLDLPAPAESNSFFPNPTVADAKVSACDAVEGTSSEQEEQDFSFKRASNNEGSRKRRVVFDFSDEEDDFKDAVNLASPEILKGQSSLGSELSAKASVMDTTNLSFDKQKEDTKPKVKEEKAINREPKKTFREDSIIGKCKNILTSPSNISASPSDSTQDHIPDSDVIKKDKASDFVPNSPKRRKVLKTWIDERGREVSEVVWEGEETESKKADNITKTTEDSRTIKTDNGASSNAVNRPPVAKKSPALPAFSNTVSSNPVGRAGNKKTGNVKDTKQGNILSFFKKV